MRQSVLYNPTLKESPKDAESLSHSLLLKAGFIRPIASGLFSYLPLGFRVLEKVKAIIYDELAQRGVQHISLPNLHPAELWQESGRWEELSGEVLFQLKNHQGKEYCLALSNEEVVSHIVRQGLSSYKQLPLILNQLQWKYRDELRPRGGLLRLKEFLMQDAYSFCADEEQLDETYQRMIQGYQAIFSRCGVTTVQVSADSGKMGGKFSHEFMILAESGEDRVITCNACHYKANVEKATTRYLHCNPHEVQRTMVEKNVQRDSTVDAQSKYYQVSSWRILKTILYRGDEKDVIAVVLRGDLNVNDKKLANTLSYTSLRLLRDDELQTLGTVKGFISPIGLPKVTRILYDLSLQTVTNFITGANKEGVDLVDVAIGKDIIPPEYVDIAEVGATMLCPECKDGILQETRGVEVGHIFKLGTRYSKPMKILFTTETGSQQEVLMGCFGIGVDRIIAGVVEQKNDEKGIIWPDTIAPYTVHLLSLDGGDASIRSEAEELYKKLTDQHIEVLFDDRDEKAGVKFGEADLIGIPWRIVVSKKSKELGGIELKRRDSDEKKILPIDQIDKWIASLH